MGRLLPVAAVLLTLGVLGSFTDDPPRDPTQRRGDAGSGRASDTGGNAGPRTTAVKDRGDRNRDPRGPTRGPSREGPSSPPLTHVVSRVVDGDTLELGNGETVRVVGIDTPEVGECGFEESAAALGRLTQGKQVTLTASDEDRDQYGRLLRYVDVGGLDTGLRLIREGLAVARYDSRDGYGFHPREPRYVAADKATPGIRCAAPRPFASVPGPGGACAPGYTPCVPPSPPDVDCGDVDGPIRVTGGDPHALDADGDGVACE